MSESALSIMIAVFVLLVLAAFVPCMEGVARFVRRRAQSRAQVRAQSREPQSTRSFNQDVA